MNNDELDALWAKRAITAELTNLSQCGDDNPHRPDSEYWKSLIRIASVLKGTGKRHYNPATILAEVHRLTPPTIRTKGKREKDIDYLWSRAFNAAYPRYRGE